MPIAKLRRCAWSIAVTDQLHFHRFHFGGVTLNNSDFRWITTILLVFLGSTQSSAGIVVLDGNGIVTKWTSTDGTEYNFIAGSYNAITATGGVITDVGDGSDASTLAQEIQSDLDAINDTPTPDQTVMYMFYHDDNSVTHNTTFAWHGQSISGTQWHPYEDDIDLDATTHKVDIPGIALSTSPNSTIYWASTTEPASNVPEPSTAIAMGLLGIVGFAGNRRRRRQMSAA